VVITKIKSQLVTTKKTNVVPPKDTPKYLKVLAICREVQVKSSSSWFGQHQSRYARELIQWCDETGHEALSDTCYNHCAVCYCPYNEWNSLGPCTYCSKIMFKMVFERKRLGSSPTKGCVILLISTWERTLRGSPNV